MRRILLCTVAALALGTTGAIAAPGHGGGGHAAAAAIAGGGGGGGMSRGAMAGANAGMQAHVNGNFRARGATPNMAVQGNRYAAAPNTYRNRSYAYNGNHYAYGHRHHWRHGWYGGGFGLFAYEPDYDYCYNGSPYSYYNGYPNGCYYGPPAYGPGWNWGWGG